MYHNRKKHYTFISTNNDCTEWTHCDDIAKIKLDVDKDDPTVKGVLFLYEILTC